MHMSAPRRLVVAVALFGLATAGCASGDDAASPSLSQPSASTPSPSTSTTTRPSYQSLVATAMVREIEVFPEPGAVEPSHRLTNPTEVGGPLVFLVDEERADGWLNVLLPVRPNDSTGWIRTSDVELATNDFRIVVELDAHRVTVYEADAILFREPIGVGRANAPTPGGRFYIKELLQPPTPDTVYGPYAYGLSGFSNVFETFNGGDGVIGLHGNNDPSSIGGDVSAGCIRLQNDTITRLVEDVGLPLGTPVEVLA